MNRPRDSILYLFDPLNLMPSTPRRDVTTPDSDKENSAPVIAQSYEQLTMTTFFNRNYHVHHKNLQNSSPQTPKGLLVDVTMDGGVLPSLEASSPGPDDAASSPEINLNDSEDEPDSLVTEFLVTPCEPVTPLPSSPRTPLADIGLRGEMTVLPRKKVYTRDVLAARAALAETESFPKLHSPSDMTPAPQDVPLASAVGDVNSSGVSSANCTLGNVFTSSNSQTAGNCETTVPVCTYSEESVERVVSLPSDLSTSTSSNLSNSFLGSSTATLLVNTHIPLSITPPSPPAVDESGTNDVTCPIPTLTASLETQAQTHLRPHKTTSSLDPRPVSVDLQSSFIQCTETSFDLLNDTVSFFGAGGRGEGVMDEDEDSFDINIQRRDRDSVEINKEAHSVEEMVSRLGKIELGSRRGVPVRVPATVMSTISESVNSSPESEPKAMQQSSSTLSSAKATPRLFDGIRINQRGLTLTTCSSVSPTTTPGQSVKKTQPLNKIPSPASLADWGMSDDGSDGDERGLALAFPPRSITTSISAPVFIPPPPQTPSPPRTPPRMAAHIAPVPQVQVPALRIVKRTMPKRTGSIVPSSSGEKGAPLVQKTMGMIGRGGSGMMGSLPQSRKHEASGSSGSGSASVSASTSFPAGPARPGRLVMPSRVAAPSTSSVSIGAPGPVRYVGGPVRVPMVEKSGTEGHPSAPRYGVKSGSQKHGLGVVAGAGGSGLTARRIPASAQGNAKAPTPTGAGVVSGLKAPARYAAGGTTLPRPVSRLPAPSGPGRVKMIGLTVGGGNGGGLVRRAGGHGL